MKKVLIVSPYFPPANAADMQRVRMSLPYFEEFGWVAEVVTCEHQYYDCNTDELLLRSLPSALKIHYVKAFDKKWTSKIGLGSLALRSLWFYKQKVNQILKTQTFDLIYFSTTQFPVCILGAYWKKKFGIPYVIDMQDPWYSDYYQDKPKHERPAKYWFSYRLNKYLEPIAMKNVDGLIAVSEQYHKDLTERYKLTVPCATVTFGAFLEDLEIAKKNKTITPSQLRKEKGKINVGYIGRGGHDMADAIKILLNTFKSELQANSEYFNTFKFHFIGTSYAAKGKGKPTISPVAEQLALSTYVTEQTDRISFYETLNTLADFDILFICGSNDPKYTASKIYPYLLLEKPLLAIFHEESSVVPILAACSNATVITFQDTTQMQSEKIIDFLMHYKSRSYHLNQEAFSPFTAKEMTRKQCELFQKALN